ncbi:hypothetical protein GCM10027299_52500 [Larkinella ripae]
MYHLNLNHIKLWQKHTTSEFDTLRYYSFNWKDAEYSELDHPSAAEFEKIIKAYNQGNYLYEQLTQLRQLCLDILGGKLPDMRKEWNNAMDPNPFDPFCQFEWLFD